MKPSDDKRGKPEGEDAPKRRKRYEPPTIEQHSMREIVTLGTSGPKPKNPGHGC